MGLLHGEAQIRNATKLPGATALDLPADGILEAFRPNGVALNLAQDSPNVAEGMRITFELLNDMKRRCASHGVEFLVAVIPTKETVFADLFAKQPGMPLAETIGHLIDNEAKAREKTFERLRRDGIDFVDTLPALREARGAQLYARTAGDMHPNGNGYRVIAHSVLEALRHLEAAKP
jgi:hypothetical protein